MRFLFLFLSTFSLLNINSAHNCTGIFCCILETIEEEKLPDDDTGLDLATENGYLYRVMGLHHDCHVFYGWLHQVIYAAKESKIRFNASNYDCIFRRIVYIRTQGVSREMMLLIDGVGRRVRLQNVMSFKMRREKEEENLVWLKVNPRDRSEMIYTGQIDPGFDIVTTFNANYRVFVVARSVSNIRIYELRVVLDKDSTPHAYLRKHYYDLNPILFPPLEHFLVRVVHFGVNETISGITTVPTKHLYSKWMNRTTALPFISMVTNSLRDVVLDHTSQQYTYRSKEKHFKANIDKKCDSMFTYMFYFHQTNPRLRGDMNAKWSGFPMTTRRSLNPRNVHRRMSYPHVVLRKTALNQRQGWVEQIGVFSAFVVVIVLVAACLRFLTALVKKELKKRNTTSSTLTH